MTTRLDQLDALAEPTDVLLERVASLHKSMMPQDGAAMPTGKHALGRALLHLYKSKDSTEHMALIFEVPIQDVEERKCFFDHLANILNVLPSLLVTTHLLQSEDDEMQAKRGSFRRTPDTALRR